MLQPLDTPDLLWSDIAMDFIDGLPNSNGFTAIWVIVDHFSKAAHFLPLKHPYHAQDLANMFMEHIFKLLGMPASIVGDRDPTFLSSF